MHIFEDYATLDTIADSDLVLYCPRQHNFRAIDGLIVRFEFRRRKGEKGKCFMFPPRIAVGRGNIQPVLYEERKGTG